MEDSDRELFARSVRHAAETGNRSGAGVALDDSLGALGWNEALAEDPRTAVSVLFELQGATGARSSALTAVLRHGLGMTSPTTGALVLPQAGRTVPPGRLEHGALTVAGLIAGIPVDGSPVTVVATTGGDSVVVEVSAGDLALRPVDGVAPRLGLVEAVGTEVPHRPSHRLETGRWAQGTALARLAVGHELVGASRQMLELAREHSLERVQFDRPISSFQAVRHRLADTLVAVEAADAALQSAWDEGSPESASMAKAVAGRASRTTARHCQQVLAGIGFTTEHDFHRFYRRVLVLDQLFGTASSITRQFGLQLLDTRQLPNLPPL